MLLHDLTIENFRSFEKYKLDKLARVNLLVGDNNCGKTSVLEAVAILMASDSVTYIQKILCQRGEIISRVRTDDSDVYRLDLKGSLFYRETSGESSSEQVRIYSEEAGRRLTMSFGKLSELRESDSRVDAMIGSDERLAAKVFRNASHALTFSHVRMNHDDPANLSIFGSDAAGSLRVEGYPELQTEWLIEEYRDDPPVGFAPTVSYSLNALAQEWKSIASKNLERFVVESVSVILPEVEEIVFLPEQYSVSGSRLECILRNRDDSRPLSNFGEGTGRLIGIGILLASTSTGTLLIDEIDTGLHYSRLADMWKMVITAAQKLDVQVFATTHSLDCIRGLAEAVRNDESFADEVALFKIDRRQDKAVRIGGDELEIVVDQEIEVR